MFVGWWLIPGVLLEGLVLWGIHPRKGSAHPPPSDKPEDGQYLTLEGKIESAPELLTSPVDGLECVAFHLYSAGGTDPSPMDGEAAPFVLATADERLWIRFATPFASYLETLPHGPPGGKGPAEEQASNAREGLLQVGDSIVINGLFKKGKLAGPFRSDPSSERLQEWVVDVHPKSGFAYLHKGDFKSTLGVGSPRWNKFVFWMTLFAIGLTGVLLGIDSAVQSAG